eukprot:GEMP01019900.1.p1 GENE.GEMP01019900.1~~GEMP01019900.1.p1  ORF type:complete len:685 (+),score=152.25 GEMP01019900.1:101-2155(+)
MDLLARLYGDDVDEDASEGTPVSTDEQENTCAAPINSETKELEVLNNAIKEQQVHSTTSNGEIKEQEQQTHATASQEVRATTPNGEIMEQQTHAATEQEVHAITPNGEIEEQGVHVEKEATPRLGIVIDKAPVAISKASPLPRVMSKAISQAVPKPAPSAPPNTPATSSASRPAAVGVLDIQVNAAPDVDAFGDIVPVTESKKLMTNPKMDRLFNPVGEYRALLNKPTSHQMGDVESHHMSHFNFDNQYNSFNTFGGASGLESNDRRSVYDGSTKDGRKRIKADDPTDLSGYLGPWAGFIGEAERREKARVQEEERKKEIALMKIEEEKTSKATEEQDMTKERVTSIFHGKKEVDYQGRSWMVSKNQQDTKERDEEAKCFLPKKWIHSFEGHTMGVQAVRMFPKTGHLLLSCSMDAKIKIWDFANQRKCLRTYMGHDQAVREIQFTTNGERFYSCSYDKNVNLWDTETGQVISTFTNKKTPFCVSIHPDPAKQNTIICGCSNKKAVEYDANTGLIVQEYDEHLGSVNTVTFVDDARRIVTTSDDKKIFVWEYGIPVVAKYISDPTMHSVPSVTMHPSGNFVCGQSMNNKIITYEARGRFKFQAQRVFRGHTNGGYAIQCNFSPDGRFIMSGDTEGKLWFWDWARGKNFRTIKAHDGVCIGCVWHPTQPSKVITCGWDGIIKLWD